MALADRRFWSTPGSSSSGLFSRAALACSDQFGVGL